MKQLEQEVSDLRAQLEEKVNQIKVLKKSDPKVLSNEEINRYSRQILLSEVRVSGQLKLKRSSVLIVGK